MALQDIGDNIEKAAEGVDKAASSAKNNTWGWAILAIVAAAVVVVISFWRASMLVPDAIAKQRKEDEVDLRAQKRYSDSMDRVHITDSALIVIYKEKLQEFNKKVDSLKNN